MPNERRRRSDEDRPSVANDQPAQPARVTEDAVRGRAYEIYEGRGGEHGHDLDDWFEAERELAEKDK